MSERPLIEPTEHVIIWSAWRLLALLLDLGAAFSLWMGLHRADHGLLANGAVGGLGLGLFFIGFATERAIARTF